MGCKIQGFTGRLFLRGIRDVGKSVVSGPLWEAFRVWAGSDQTLLLQKTEACFLGGFVDDAGHRIVSAVTVPGAWVDCGVVAETIEDLATQEALCVLV